MIDQQRCSAGLGVATAPAAVSVGDAEDRADWLVPLAFAAVYLIWGSTYLGIAVAIESVPPFLMAATRFLGAGAALYAWLRWQGAAPPTLREWGSSLLVGLLLIFGGNGLVTYAQQYVPSGTAALFIATVPLWMIVLGRLFFGAVAPGRPTWIGLGLGFLGVSVLVSPRGLAVESGQALGSLLLLLAALSWAYGSLASRKLPLPRSPLMVAALQMICGSALLFAASAVLGEWRGFDPAQVTTRSWLAMLYLGVFGSIIGYTAYLYLLQRVEPAAVGTYAFVNPAVAVGLGWLFAGEILDLRTAMAMALILSGVAVILWRQAVRRRRSERGQAARARS